MFTLNEQGKPVNKDNKTVIADDIRRALQLKDRNSELYQAATQRGMIAILRAGNEAGYEGTEPGKGAHASGYTNKKPLGENVVPSKVKKSAGR